MIRRMLDRLVGRKGGTGMLRMPMLAAFLALAAPLGLTFGGLAISEDGGLEELHEFFFVAARDF